jgi:hypothetical protein
MFTRAGLNCASTMGCGGSALSAGASSASKADARQPGSFLKGRWFNSASNPAIAVLSSPRLKKRRWRSRARIQRSTTWTPTSTLAFS